MFGSLVSIGKSAYFIRAITYDAGLFPASRHRLHFITIFFKVVLPIMFSAFVAGFTYTFMTTMMSLSSVIFLVTPGFDLASEAAKMAQRKD